ncbi:hypothetical protein ACWY4P_00775 [Streptomyces sp. LZ34]
MSDRTARSRTAGPCELSEEADALLADLSLPGEVFGAIILTGVSQETQGQLDTAVQEARCWLEEQAEVRRDLFARLDQAVTAQDPKQVRQLLIRVMPSCWDD